MKYVAPQTKSSEVELENNFCGSVFVDKEDSESLTIDNQILNPENEFDFTDGTELNGNGWD